MFISYTKTYEMHVTEWKKYKITEKKFNPID